MTANTPTAHNRLWRRAAQFTVVALLAWPVVASAQETVTYYTTDALGSVRMVTDSGGAVVARYDYRPFGDPCGSACGPQGTTEKRQFAGLEKDGETGLDYAAARYYSNGMGRFTTVDPDHVGGNLFDPQSWNAYAYARNNPLRFIDPFGLECTPADYSDTSTCVPGKMGSGELVFDFSRWILEQLIVDYWRARTSDGGVYTSATPFGPTAFAAATRFGPLLEGPLPATVANTFRSASYTASTLTRSTTLYRVWGGTADEFGSFWTRTPPRGALQSKMDLGINPQWGNTATKVVKIQVPAGTRIFEGVAAAQGGFLGGGSQIYIPTVLPSWVIR